MGHGGGGGFGKTASRDARQRKVPRTTQWPKAPFPAKQHAPHQADAPPISLTDSEAKYARPGKL